jgi:hypothetical protein
MLYNKFLYYKMVHHGDWVLNLLIILNYDTMSLNFCRLYGEMIVDYVAVKYNLISKCFIKREGSGNLLRQ